MRSLPRFCPQRGCAWPRRTKRRNRLMETTALSILIRGMAVENWSAPSLFAAALRGRVRLLAFAVAPGGAWRVGRTLCLVVRGVADAATTSRTIASASSKNSGQRAGSVPEGRIIALGREAGYQADLLRGGIHFGLWRWQYRVHKTRAGHDRARQDRLRLRPRRRAVAVGPDIGPRDRLQPFPGRPRVPRRRWLHR